MIELDSARFHIKCVCMPRGCSLRRCVTRVATIDSTTTEERDAWLQSK